MKTTPQAPTQSNPRVYVLKPADFALSVPNPLAAPKAKLSNIAVSVSSVSVPATLPPRQPLPRPVIDPAKPMLKLGLDVHLEFIMAVAQKGHTSLQAPRKFTRAQLVEQVRRWRAEGFQVFCVQESCGFGFVLHRKLVAAGAQSFLITPWRSMISARPTSSMPAPCASGSPAGWGAIAMNSPPSASPVKPSSANAPARAAANSSGA